MENCVFCAFENDTRGVKVLENEHCYYVACNDPILIGWGMILPKKHRESVFDLTPEEWKSTYLLLEKVKAMIDRQFEPGGYNVGWNVGEVGGQTVFHAHLHIIPRYDDEPYAGKGIRHWFKQDDNRRTKIL